MSAAGALFLMRDASLGVTNAFKSSFLRFCWSFCAVFVLLWVAVMMYITFYYAYMPTVRHVYPVHLQFKSECGKLSASELCSYPEGNVTFSTGERMLMRGQRYQVYLDLDMPQSEVNEKLGMFMVQVKFLSSTGAVLSHSSRSCMLHYKSGLLQSLSTLFFSLPMLTGFLEEKQIVPVQLHENYIEDSYRPAVAINVVVLTKKIELYSASLRIEALFTGLRFIMFRWPGTSALVGVTCNFIAISIIFFFAYSAFTPEPFCEESDTEDNAEDISSLSDESQAQHVFRRQHSSDESLRRSTAPQAAASLANGRCKPIGSNLRSYKVKNCPQSVPLTPHDFECSEGLLRSATFPPYRWECDGEGEKPRTGTQATALWASPVRQTHCSTHRSSSFGSCASCVGRFPCHLPVTRTAVASAQVPISAEVHKRENRIKVERAGSNRLIPFSNHHNIEICASCYADCANSAHPNILEIGSVFCDERRDVSADKGLELLEARCVHNRANGGCACDYRPSYEGTSFCVRKVSQTSSCEEHNAIEPSVTSCNMPRCAVCGTGPTLICNCGATRIYACDGPFKGRVPDGAPAETDQSVQSKPADNVSPNFKTAENESFSYEGKYEDKSEDKSQETVSTSEEKGSVEDDQEPKLKRRSVDKNRASLKLSLKKMISKK